MARISSKFIRFGTGTGEVNSRLVPANFTPTNYTPSQVASEGTDKVSAHLKGIDNQLGAISTATDIAPTSYTSSNDVVSNENVTALVFDSGVRAFTALVGVYINATTPQFKQYTLSGVQKSSSWEMSVDGVGDTQTITFSINSSGQVQFSKTTNVGFVSTKFSFRALTVAV